MRASLMSRGVPDVAEEVERFRRDSSALALARLGLSPRVHFLFEVVEARIHGSSPFTGRHDVEGGVRVDDDFDRDR